MKSRRIRRVGHVTHMEETINTYTNFNFENLKKPQHIEDGNIKMTLKETGYESIDKAKTKFLP
jgi:hypothetical protein